MGVAASSLLREPADKGVDHVLDPERLAEWEQLRDLSGVGLGEWVGAAGTHAQAPILGQSRTILHRFGALGAFAVPMRLSDAETRVVLDVVSW